jgi:hypothetical protein
MRHHADLPAQADGAGRQPDAFLEVLVAAVSAGDAELGVARRVGRQLIGEVQEALVAEPCRRRTGEPAESHVRSKHPGPVGVAVLEPQHQAIQQLTHSDGG